MLCRGGRARTISACLTVRGKPSSRKPFLHSGACRLSLMMPTTMSSLTRPARHGAGAGQPAAIGPLAARRALDPHLRRPSRSWPRGPSASRWRWRRAACRPWRGGTGSTARAAWARWFPCRSRAGLRGRSRRSAAARAAAPTRMTRCSGLVAHCWSVSMAVLIALERKESMLTRLRACCNTRDRHAAGNDPKLT